MKPEIIGLMITCNEEWIIKQSITILLKYVDAVFVLDASTDMTREILEEMDQVIVFYQENYSELTNYGEYRQFLLDAGRTLGYEYFVCIDADETFPKSLTPSSFDVMIGKLPVGWAYQFDVWNFYGDLYTYTDKGRIGNKFIDVIFHDDGKMKYENRMVVHEKRTPATDYIKWKWNPLYHYGCLDSRKMDARRMYYMLLEASNDIRSIASINFDYYVNSCFSRYYKGGSLKSIYDNAPYDIHDEMFNVAEPDCGEHFLLKCCEIYGSDFDKYVKLNLSGTMSPIRIFYDRIVELVKTKDLRVMFKSVKDYIILDILKKW